MIVHTQETLNSLTRFDLRKLHAELGLVVPVASRTREGYEARILRAQSQKVKKSLAAIAPQAEEDKEPPNRGDNGRGRVAPNNNSFASVIAPIESELVCSLSDLDFLYQQETQIQLAIELTTVGSKEEEIGRKKLRTIEGKITELEDRIQKITAPVPVPVSLPKIWDKATSEVAIGDRIRMPFHPIWVVADKEQMDDGRTRLLVRASSGRSEEWYLPAQRVWSLDEIEQAIAQLKADILSPKKLCDRPVESHGQPCLF